MMKKTIILSLLGLAAIIAQAQSVSSTTTQWCKLLDAAPPDMGITMTVADGSLYYLSTTGSTIGSGNSGFPKEYSDPTKSIYYDGVKVAEGAPYEGASYNNNFNLLKTGLDGSFKWTVYSTSGEAMSNNGGVVPAPDGGVYVSVAVRHTDNMRTEPLRFIDATGHETVIDWKLNDQDDKRWVQGLLMKVSANGAIEWTRLLEVSHAPQPNAKSGNADFTSIAFYISGMEGDSEGNFYVSGRYVNPITLTQADGTAITLTPHNTEGWDGDSQTSRGDMFVAKFNAQGQLVRMLTTTGTAYCESSFVLAKAGDDFVLNGMVKGATDEESVIHLGGLDITLTNRQSSMLTARIDTELNVKWVQLFKGDKVQGRDCVWQNNHVNVVGDVMWLTGMGNGMLSSADSSQTIATVTGNMREGYVIKCDAATGQWLNATFSKSGVVESLNGITGYFGGFENEEGTKFYTYGYTFAANMSTYESYGVILVEHDAMTLESTDFCSLISSGGQSTSQEFIAQGDVIYTMSRGRSVGTFLLKPINSDASIETREWAIFLSAFKLPFQVKNTSGNKPKVGDVTGDGEVDVNDVNTIINIVLGKNEASNYGGRANVDGNGEVDVNDVNTLINLVLGK
ncbi:MAG: dockerin type I repeat-containing protein [Muribaculaceae bacterium]|nr:dockerin type I repeat-containing protein [Muribaculaceae bacterium]